MSETIFESDEKPIAGDIGYNITRTLVVVNYDDAGPAPTEVVIAIIPQGAFQSRPA